MPEDRPHRSRRHRIIESERVSTEGAGVIPGGRKAGKGIHGDEGMSGPPSPPLTLGPENDTLPVLLPSSSSPALCRGSTSLIPSSLPPTSSG